LKGKLEMDREPLPLLWANPPPPEAV